MSNKKVITKCMHCNDWFESHLINAEAVENPSVKIGDNYEQCPHCNKITTVNQNTLKVI